ncbi:MAG: 30S ribosomal protein S12 methylthiotransferase RimO [Rikenellaceae bacterium]
MSNNREQTTNRTVNIITLGCSKNRVDSEHLMAQLYDAGYDILFDSDELDSEVVIINTCGFIGDAKEESVDMILAAVEAKQEGLIEELYVVGCLSQRYADELRGEIPDVDQYFGVRGWEQLVATLGATHKRELETVRELSTPDHYAYLKISEGCNWRCGYCAIPLIRGRHISIPIEELIEEAKGLVQKGVRELIVIAQDTTYYGMDIYGERRLAKLLQQLCLIEGIEWIRLHYAYPTDFPRDVIEVMARESKICKYLDIPFQHIAPSQLKSMKRRHTKEQAVELIEELRAHIPDIAIRTTMLVGYPGESEEDYNELLDFVRTTKFERLGVFPYSEEEGTYSATLTDDVPQQVKEQRAEQIMLIQSEISLQSNLSRVGQCQRVIIDDKQGDYYIARSQYDSPEVDQEILIPTAEAELSIGEFYNVNITAAEDFDLYATTIIAATKSKY